MKLLTIVILSAYFYTLTHAMEENLNEESFVAQLEKAYGKGTIKIVREDIKPHFRSESSFKLIVKDEVLNDEARHNTLQLILQKIIDLLSNELGKLLTINYNIIDLFPEEGPTLKATIKNFISSDLSARITSNPSCNRYKLTTEKELAQLNSFNIKLEQIIMKYTQKLSSLIFQDIVLPDEENNPAIVIELNLFVTKSK